MLVLHAFNDNIQGHSIECRNVCLLLLTINNKHSIDNRNAFLNDAKNKPVQVMTKTAQQYPNGIRINGNINGAPIYNNNPYNEIRTLCILDTQFWLGDLITRLNDFVNETMETFNIFFWFVSNDLS